MKRYSYILWLTFAISCLIVAQIGCSSDEENPAAQAGTGGATGGTGGIIGGQGGDAGSSAQGGSGATENGWTKGAVGRATKGAITLAANAGRIQGFAVTPGMTMRTLSNDAGLNDADIDGGTLPNTAPFADFSGITADFTEIYIPVLPYQDLTTNTQYPPLTAIFDSVGQAEIVQHFQDWESEFTTNCYGTYPVSINGQELHTYGGLSMDIADCLNRHFFVTNTSNKIWELYPDGTKQVLTDVFNTSLSALICHPEGYLIASTLPGYDEAGNLMKPVEIHKIALDGVVTRIAEMPSPADYISTEIFSICGIYPFSTYYIPTGMRVPISLLPDLSYLVGDMGAKKLYKVSKDGTAIDSLADMESMTIAAAMAPNDVIYTIEPPMVDGSQDNIVSGTQIRAFDGSTWSTLLELQGYEQVAHSMSHAYIQMPCPAGQGNECFQPFGTFFKIAFGANPNIYLVDPILGKMSIIPLDTTEPDAGVPDAGDPDADTDAALDAGADASEDASADASVE